MSYNYEHHETVTDKLARLQSVNNTLLRIIEEEFTANGGHFSSPDSDLIFRQAFCDDWENGNESTKQALERLLGRSKGLTTQETRN